MQTEKRPLVILTGPTAVGKTKLSIALAKAIGGEIISADSMQVYKQMDIGSAKIRQDEMEGVPHFMIDLLETTEEFSVVTFQHYARQYMEEIYERGHIPILVGGTGFYIQAVLYDIRFDPKQADGQGECPERAEGAFPEMTADAVATKAQDALFRQKLTEIAEQKGNRYLHGMLRQVDEEAAEQIHFNNVKRVIRALEFYMQTGEKISEHNRRQRQRGSVYNSAYFVLNDDRERLYERIDRRVDRMLEQGLVEEVKKLKAQGCDASMVSMKGLGYKEILGYLDGEYDLEQAVYLIKRDTRHFAKRQLTWFRREKDVIWVEKEAFGYKEQNMLAYMIQKCREKGILE